ncbi:MAG: cyclic nucleotide-gated ion channel [Methylococcales bacterium]
MKDQFRERVFRIIEVAELGDLPSHRFDVFIIIMIAINIAAVIIGSIAKFHIQYGVWLNMLAYISVALFSVEYLCRIWTCVDHPSGTYRHPITGRLKYLFSPLMLADLFALFPFYISLFPVLDLRILRLLRLLVMLRLTHYSDALHVLATIVRRESKTFAAIFLVIVSLLLLVSYFIYVIERHVQPDAFASIPEAMWWSISTLTTVGYGDVVPVTTMGKVFGMIVMLIGIGMFAIPTGILVSAFSQEMKRKDFVATWNLVAKVPLFSDLDAAEIANITELLHLRSVMPGEIIIRKGEVAHRMYFIVAGEVEVDLANHPARLKEGDFFGELGVLYKIRRTANVTANTFVELLQLENRDLEALLEANPKLGERITQKASMRRDSINKLNQ